MDLVRQIVRALRLASRQVESEVGVSAAQLFVLTQLADGAPASLGELAGRTLTDRSSVAAVVDRLAARRFVTRGTSPEDRRRAAIRITPAGAALLRRAPRAPTVRLIDALARFDDAELSNLVGSLTMLFQHLGGSVGRPPMLFEDDATGAPAARRGGARPERTRRPSRAGRSTRGIGG